MNRAMKKAGIKEHDFHTGEIIMNYVAGPDHGPPLVFIPGQSITWEEYYLILPMLADRFQAYAVTLRGHGKSSWTPGRYTFNRLGADMTAFLKEVVRRPAVVIGNSSGGVLAAWLAANAREHVKAIVLEDPRCFAATSRTSRGPSSTTPSSTSPRWPCRAAGATPGSSPTCVRSPSTSRASSSRCPGSS